MLLCWLAIFHLIFNNLFAFWCKFVLESTNFDREISWAKPSTWNATQLANMQPANTIISSVISPLGSHLILPKKYGKEESERRGKGEMESVSDGRRTEEWGSTDRANSAFHFTFPEIERYITAKMDHSNIERTVELAKLWVKIGVGIDEQLNITSARICLQISSTDDISRGERASELYPRERNNNIPSGLEYNGKIGVTEL